jgi:hypothetical protein
MISEHRDDSELSFVVTLNDTFQGGGTRFIADGTTTTTTTTDTTVAPNCGAGVFSCGRRLHSGVEVIEGTRT